jgi:predicted MFS family arabinose efflux permease
LLQTPISFAAVIAVSTQLKEATKEQSNWRDNIKRVDFLGALIVVGAVLGLLVGLDRGSNVSWSLPLTIISLSVSGALFVAFVLVEIYVAKEPFAPGHIIFNRNLFACYLCNFFSFGGWLAAIYFLPLFYQAADGISATRASVLLIPCITVGVTGSLFGGWAMRYTGKYYWLTVTGYGLLTTGLTVIFLFSGMITTSTVVIVVGSTMCAFGNGIGVTTTLIALSKHPRVYFHALLEGVLKRRIG